jgi:integrase
VFVVFYAVEYGMSRFLIARGQHEIRASKKAKEETHMSRRRFGYLRQLPSGRWQASYLGPDQERYRAPHTFKTRNDGAQWLNHEEAHIITGQWMLRKNITPPFGDYCENFIATQTTSSGEALKPTTQHLYRTLLRVHLQPFHLVALADITPDMVRNWWSETTQDGKRTSRSRAYKLMSATFTRAVEDGVVRRTPCVVRGAHTAVTGKKIVVPTAEETKRIIDNMNPRFMLLTMVLANSGLRFGEAVALRRSDLSPATMGGADTWEISVTKTAVLVGGVVTTQAPKTEASIRTLKLRPEVGELITALLSTLPSGGDPLLFTNGSGGYIRNDVYTNSFRRALKKAGVDPHVTPHSLRHFAGSEYGRAGANVAELSRYLGDKSKEAVLRYLHSTDRGDDLLGQMRFVG